MTKSFLWSLPVLKVQSDKKTARLSARVVSRPALPTPQLLYLSWPSGAPSTAYALGGVDAEGAKLRLGLHRTLGVTLILLPKARKERKVYSPFIV